MNLQQQEQFYQMMTRVKANSRAASSQVPKDDVIVTEIVDGLIVSKPAKKIEYIRETKEENESEPIVIDLQKSKAGSDVTKYYYDMSLPSTGDQVFKCGLHEFETKNVTEFNRHVENHGSKAASSVGSVNKVKAIAEFFNSKRY